MLLRKNYLFYYLPFYYLSIYYYLLFISFSRLYSPYFYIEIKRINIHFFSKETMAFYLKKKYAAYQAV